MYSRGLLQRGQSLRAEPLVQSQHFFEGWHCRVKHYGSPPVLETVLMTSARSSRHSCCNCFRLKFFMCTGKLMVSCRPVLL